MDELLGIFPKEAEGNFQSQKFVRPEWEIGDRFLFVHLPPVLLSRNLMFHQLFQRFVIIITSTVQVRLSWEIIAPFGLPVVPDV